MCTLKAVKEESLCVVVVLDCEGGRTLRTRRFWCGFKGRGKLHEARWALTDLKLGCLGRMPERKRQ